MRPLLLLAVLGEVPFIHCGLGELNGRRDPRPTAALTPSPTDHAKSLPTTAVGAHELTFYVLRGSFHPLQRVL